MPVYDKEKTDDDQLRDITGVNKAEEKAMEARAYDGAELGATEAAAGRPRGSKADSKERAALDDKADNGFFNADKDKPKRRFSLRGMSRRNKLAGGGAVGIGAGGIITVLIGIQTGPLEFIHIGQILRAFHHSVNEDQGDIKTGRLLRYLKDTSKPQDARMGYLANKHTDKFEARLNATGLKSQYTSIFGFTDGVIIDTDNPKYAGLSEDEVRQKVISTYGISDGDIKGDLDKGLTIEGKAFEGIGKYRASNRFYRSALSEAGYSKISSWVGARALTKRAGVTWHPISRLDQKLASSVEDRLKAWKEKRTEQISKGEKSPTFTGASTDPDADENSTPSGDSEEAISDTSELLDEADEAANAEPGDSQAARERLKGRMTSNAVRAAGLAGLICTAHAFNETYDDIKQSSIILPLIRVGMSAIAMGSQLEFGEEDIDIEEYGFAHDTLLNGKNADGQVSNFSDASSYQAELGKDGGYKPDSVLTKIGESSPFDVLNDEPLKTFAGGACSTAGQIITFGISLATGPIATLASAGAGAVFGPVVMNSLAGFLVGSPVDPLAAGSDYGHQSMYGSFLGANDNALSNGGEALNNEEESRVRASSMALRDEEFRSQSLAYRMFNTRDYRSFAGQLIDRPGSSPEHTLQNVASSLFNFGSVFKNGASALSPHAQAAENYDYGVPGYGFSEEDMENEDFINPYKVAKKAVDILEDHEEDYEEAKEDKDTDNYIYRAQVCFGVEIAKLEVGDDDERRWVVIPSGDENGKSVNAYSSGYEDYDCGDDDDDWKTIRMFISYNRTMEAMACYEGDEDACQINNGIRPEPPEPPNWTLLCKIGDKSINELSGLAASVKHKDIVYGHNDEGNIVYAINKTTCEVEGTFKVSGVRADPDPEAIQVDHTTGKIWFGDIGNGHPGQSSSMTDKDKSLKHPGWPAHVIAFDEPSEFKGQTITNTQVNQITYEGSPSGENSEALLANPKTGQGYIITKGTSSKVFKFSNPLSSGVAKDTGITIPQWVTDATYTNDGKWILIRYITATGSDPGKVLVYDAATWKRAGTLGTPPVDKPESITMNGKCHFLIGSEGENSPLYQVGLPVKYGGCESQSGGAGKLDLQNWKLTLPIGAKEITQPKLATYSDEWYHPAPDGSGQEFYVDSGADGVGSTSNSKNPRSELREMTEGGKDEAEWSSGSGTHRMLIQTKVTELSGRGHVVIGQIHDAEDDTTVFRLEKDQLWITKGDETHGGTSLGTVKLGQVITIGFDVSNNVTSYYYSPTGSTSPPKISYTLKQSYKGAYFKAGNYYQGGTDGGKSRVIISGLGVTHDGSMPNIAAPSENGDGGSSSGGSEGNSGGVISSDGFTWPVKASDWPGSVFDCDLKYNDGTVHTGVDISIPSGTKLYAAHDGEMSLPNPAFGMLNIKFMQNGKTLYFNYQHLSSTIKIPSDKRVKAGQYIGTSGKTGTSTAHLHISLWDVPQVSGHNSISSSAGREALSHMYHPLSVLPRDSGHPTASSGCKGPPFVVPGG